MLRANLCSFNKILQKVSFKWNFTNKLLTNRIQAYFDLYILAESVKKGGALKQFTSFLWSDLPSLYKNKNFWKFDTDSFIANSWRAQSVIVIDNKSMRRANNNVTKFNSNRQPAVERRFIITNWSESLQENLP